jgi:hypothetical protein
LHRETIQALLDLVAKGKYRLLIKEHPQQGTRISSQLKQYIGADDNLQKNVFILPIDCDTRQVIINADIVVGFQTTALYEAMLAGKIVIYTFWGSECESQKDKLLPFHTYPEEVLLCARSPGELKNLMETTSLNSSNIWQNPIRENILCEHLGPVDGQSSKRVLETIQAFLNIRSITNKNKHTLDNSVQKSEWITSLIPPKLWHICRIISYPLRNFKLFRKTCQYIAMRDTYIELERAIMLSQLK